MQKPIGKFYDDLDISFPVGNMLCRALKLSYEQCQRSFPSHSHSRNSWELHYIVCGRGRITLNQAPYEITPNTFFVTGPHVEHSQVPDPLDPVTEYCIYLKFEPVSASFISKENPDFLNLFIHTPAFLGQDTQNIRALMQALFRELETRGTGYLTVVRTLLLQLLVQSARNFEGFHHTGNAAATSSLSDRNYLIIEESFLYDYQELTLESLAQRLGLGTRQTERLLREHYGKTFLQKKTDSKMSAALILLSDPAKSITEISASLGYSSVEHFSGAFRKYNGISPRAWRNAKKDQAADAT